MAHPGQSAANPRDRRGLAALVDRLVGQSAARGAEPALIAATDRGARQGDYVGPSGIGQLRGDAVRVAPSAQALDPVLASELWRRSEEWAGLSFLD